MNEQQNIEMIRREYELFGRGDIDGLLGMFAANIDWTSPGPPDLMTAGQRRGHAQVREFFRAVHDLYDMQSFEPMEFIAKGDRVVVLGRDTAKVRASGKTISEMWAHVFTIKEGKVVSFVEYLDTSAVVAELRRVHARV